LVTRQCKHTAQTNGHVLTHKTWVCHDPAKTRKNQEDDGRIMTN